MNLESPLIYFAQLTYNCGRGKLSHSLTIYIYRFRLKEVADKIKRHGHVSQTALQNLRNTIVTQLIVGPNHIALLLEVRDTEF